MIPLKFIQKPKEERERLVVTYADKLFNGDIKADKNKVKSLDDWCLSHLKYDSAPCSFETLIKLPYRELFHTVKQLDQISKTEAFPDDLRAYMNTLYKSHVPRLWFVDTLGETVCPYCNRMYINRSGRHTICQLDHFFDKGTYPILAVSFYNLVPCCGTCNLIKKEKRLAYSPYDEDIASADQLIQFDYLVLDYDEMSGNTPPQKILLNCLHPNMKKNEEVLELDDLYQTHTDEVQDLIAKRRIYGERYVDFLTKHYGSIGISFDRLVVGNGTDPDEYRKRPLSKMKADIAKKIGLM